MAPTTSSTRKKIEAWWQQMHMTFMFPPMYRGHTHVWHRITSECVGCVGCGVVHQCSSTANIVPCAVEQQDDTSRVCTYTGIVLNSTTFFDPETSIADYNGGHLQHHTNTPQHMRANRKVSLANRIEVLDNIVSKVIELLFFSNQARIARETELVRFNRKICSVFTAHVARSKNSFQPCNIADGIGHCMAGIAAYRHPVHEHDIPPHRHFKHMQRVIVSLLSRIQLPRQYIFTEQNEKMKNLVISLVYISSDGISYDGHVYLPKFPGLKKILPLELVLAKCFGIQPKIVTDGENVIKMSIKNTEKKHLDLHHPANDPARACLFASTSVCTCTNIASGPLCYSDGERPSAHD